MQRLANVGTAFLLVKAFGFGNNDVVPGKIVRLDSLQEFCILLLLFNEQSRKLDQSLVVLLGTFGSHRVRTVICAPVGARRGAVFSILCSSMAFDFREAIARGPFCSMKSQNKCATNRRRASIAEVS